VQVKLEYGSTLRVYSAKRWSEVRPRYHDIPLQSPVYVPRKDRQLVCQHVNSYQAGTVDSPKTTMSRVSSPKPVKGIERKCSGRRLRTSNGFETHEALWQMLTTKSLNRSSICVLHHVRSSFGGVISATFPYATSCLAPVLEGGPE
jgi:hypothetical protein